MRTFHSLQDPDHADLENYIQIYLPLSLADADLWYETDMAPYEELKPKSPFFIVFYCSDIGDTEMKSYNTNVENFQWLGKSILPE